MTCHHRVTTACLYSSSEIPNLELKVIQFFQNKKQQQHSKYMLVFLPTIEGFLKQTFFWCCNYCKPVNVAVSQKAIRKFKLKASVNILG